MAAKAMPGTAPARYRPYLILAPAFLLTVGILVPFVAAIWLSLTDFSFRSADFSFIGLENFSELIHDDEFWHACAVTLRYAFWATSVEMALGLGIALLLNRDNLLARALRVVLIFPLVIAPVIATLIWQLMTNPSVGVLGKALHALGLGDFKWGAAPESALFSVVLIDVWVYTPFIILLVLAGLRSLPRAPFEAALLDGGSPWFVFRNLTLPMLAPVLLIALLFRLMLAMQEFAIIFTLTKGGPGDTLMSLPLLAYTRGFLFYDLGRAIPTMLVLWTMIYLFAFVLVKWWTVAQRRAAGACVGNGR